MNDGKLIANLTEALPATEPVRPVREALFWSISSYLMIIALTLITGNLRFNWIEQLTQKPMFAIQMLAGFITTAYAVTSIYKQSIPGEQSSKSKKNLVPFIGFGFVIFLLLIDLIFPSIGASEIGHRNTCLFQVMIFGLLPSAFLFSKIRNLYPYNKINIGASIAIAAYMPAAMLMHIACKYDPVHMIFAHFMPVFVMSCATAFLAKRFFNKQSQPI